MGRCYKFIKIILGSLKQLVILPSVQDLYLYITVLTIEYTFSTLQRAAG